MLWRALKHISAGFYIDIGAQHPIVDSVSKAFYEHGWRGMHVEPTGPHVELLRNDRPDEQVIQAVVGDSETPITFYEIPGGGLSTARRNIAELHARNYECEVREITVDSVRLETLFEKAGNREIHWMKIDVEGFEKEVLSGWGGSTVRPWIVIVEATFPNTQIDTFSDWESEIDERGYRLVYRDGLNRFYLSEKHLNLSACFEFPPNVFDQFQLSGTATSFTTDLVLAYKAKINEMKELKK